MQVPLVQVNITEIKLKKRKKKKRMQNIIITHIFKVSQSLMNVVG